MSTDFIGRGLSFPFAVNAAGGLRLVGGQEEIEQAIRLVLGTAYGERPMRPEFGCGIHDFVFAPADGATAARIAFEVRSALSRWEPRIDVVDVVVTRDSTHEAALYIDVRYALRDSYDVRSLVFPFYTIPTEG